MLENLNVLIVDDKKEDYDDIVAKVTTILKEHDIPAKIVFDHVQVLKLISYYINSKTTGRFCNRYVPKVEELVEDIPEDNLICIVDCNLGYNETDRYGIDLTRDYLDTKTDYNNIRLTSVARRAALLNEPNGYIFIQKPEEYNEETKDAYALDFKDKILSMSAVMKLIASSGEDSKNLSGKKGGTPI